MDTKIKKWLFYFIFIVVFLPLVEQRIQFIKSAKLNGGFRAETDTNFSLHNWIDGSYQRQKELFLNDQTGFRPDLVRLINQIKFSVFDKCKAGWTVKGKNQYLFQWPYIHAYYGTDFVGYQAICEKSLKLKAIQDTLSRLGKSMILVYAPSKASSYPEYFREYDIPRIKGTTNYETYRKICDSLGINQIDMDAWFVSMKNKSKEPLFSKQGIHWTNYGATLAGDSLMKYIEKLRNIQIQHPDWSNIEHDNKLRFGDNDIASELNLIFPVANETMGYPVIKPLENNNQKKINAIYIGDSYGFKMVGFGIINKMNTQCQYWAYFDEVHDINNGGFALIRDFNWKEAIKNTDCVILVYTSFNLQVLGNGFIEQAYDYYYPKQ